MKQNPHRKYNRRKAAGFTLLEMVIVLGIIGLIIGGAIGVLGGVREGAAITTVKGDMQGIGSALKMYKINNTFYPSQAQGLKALVTRPGGSPVPKSWTKLMDRVPLDPWGQEYQYKFPGTKNKAEFEIISKGKDTQQGTEDDITSQAE